MPKPIPSIGQQNWGPTLNSHLAQLQNKDTGGINYGTTAQRPTLTAGDDGYTYFDTTTKQVLRWSGGTNPTWEIILVGLPNNQPPATGITINGQSVTGFNISGTALSGFTVSNGIASFSVNDTTGGGGGPQTVTTSSTLVGSAVSQVGLSAYFTYGGTYIGPSGTITAFNVSPGFPARMFRQDGTFEDIAFSNIQDNTTSLRTGVGEPISSGTTLTAVPLDPTGATTTPSNFASYSPTSQIVTITVQP